MKNLQNSVLFRVFAILVLVLVLLIPTQMVKDLIREREGVQRNAIQEVSAKWGNAQTLTGPFISIPYDKYVKQISQKEGSEKIVKTKEWIHILPENLNINGKLSPEKRYRGIYEVVVYESTLKIEGVFTDIDLSSFDIDSELIHLDHASLNIGITDLKGIEKQIGLLWNGQNIFFDSGLSSMEVERSGINAKIPIKKDGIEYKFSMEIDLKGSQQLFFVPMGKTTDVDIQSKWQTPSFTGTYLPDSREVGEDGFNAKWNILHLNRNYPQRWLGANYRVKESAFGIELFLPVDSFTKTHRVARYAILFLALTFMVFFFVEVMNQIMIHPLQYLLVGIALVIFYVLLLSISEHIRFNLAYLISTIATLGLITTYTTGILKSRKFGMLIFVLLSILYLFIFVLIQLEDYALLIGSLGLFTILGIVMYFSRKIDWYELKIGKQKELNE